MSTTPAAVEKRSIKEKDSAVLKAYQKTLKLQASMQKQSDNLKRRRTSSKDVGDERTIKKLRSAGQELVKLHENLENARSQGSGSILTPDLQEPTQFIESVMPNQQLPPSCYPVPWPRPGVSMHSGVHNNYNSFSPPLPVPNSPRIQPLAHQSPCPPIYPTQPYPSSSQHPNYFNRSPSLIQHNSPQPYYPPPYYPPPYPSSQFYPLPYPPPYNYPHGSTQQHRHSFHNYHYLQPPHGPPERSLSK